MYILPNLNTELMINSERKVFQSNVFPEGLRKFRIEGNIMLGKILDKTVFFNSKFESGNLRQVF